MYPRLYYEKKEVGYLGVWLLSSVNDNMLEVLKVLSVIVIAYLVNYPTFQKYWRIVTIVILIIETIPENPNISSNEQQNVELN